MPKVSVLMGIYNCASTLQEALDSLYAQTFQDFDIILCDDGSSDNTYQIAAENASKHNNIILLKNDQNLKLAATLNHCLKYADGEYVARMDGDDISLPERFEKEVEFLDNHSEFAIVSCPMFYFDSDGVFGEGTAIQAPTKNDFGRGTPFCHAPSMMRTSVLREIGGYTCAKRVERMEDFYLWYQFYKRGYKGYNLNEPLYKMRDGRDAVSRRRIKNRLLGMMTDIEVFNGLKLPIKYSVKSVVKNVIILLIPSSLYQRIHKGRKERQQYLVENERDINRIISLNGRNDGCDFKPVNRYSVSVIVPVYNVSRYVNKCVESIFSQSLQDLQIIFIDDCSTDDSIKIIQDVLQKYPSRIPDTLFITMPRNSGLAAARREGYLNAEGEYTICCDSDDWVDLDYYETLLNEARCLNADIVIGGIAEHKENKTNKSNTSLYGSGKDILEHWYTNPIHMSECNKLIRRSVLVDNSLLPYNGINMWEDNGLMHRVFYYCQKVGSVAGTYYHYNRINQTAITHGYSRHSVNQMIACATLLDVFYQKVINPERFIKTRESLKFLARINLLTGDRSDFQSYKKTFPETDSIIKDISKESFSRKGYIRYLFVKYHLAWLFNVVFYGYKKIF